MLELYKVIDQIVDTYNLELPELYKRRDPKEPFRAKKEAFEDKMFGAIMRMFRRQRRSIKEQLQRMLPQRSFKQNMDEYLRRLDLSDPKGQAELLRIFTQVSDEAIGDIAMNADIQVDWEAVNQDMLDWVNEHYYEHLAGDKKLSGFFEELNNRTLERLETELQNFIREPGYTIGDVMGGLGGVFGESRALRIATTEITRAYSQADQVAGEALLREVGEDAPVIKTW